MIHEEKTKVPDGHCGARLAELPAWAQDLPIPAEIHAFPAPPPQQIEKLPETPPPPQINKPAETPPPSISIGVMPDVLNPPKLDLTADGQQPARSWWSTGTLYGGAGGAYLVPYFSSNPAFFTTGTSGGRTVNTQQNFGTHGDGAATVFLGYTLDSGLGIQGNWLSFFNGTNSHSATLDGTTSLFDAGGNSLGTPSKGSSANATSELNILMFNFEITQKWVFGDCLWLRLGGGVAYAHFDQNYQLHVSDIVNGSSAVNAGHGFTGWGPTVSFEIHRRLFDSGFGLYGTARGSLLFGWADQNYQLTSANPLVAQTLGSSSSSGSCRSARWNWGRVGTLLGSLRVYGRWRDGADLGQRRQCGPGGQSRRQLG